MESTSDRWGFCCPWHGLEMDVFCWRAFQDENVSLWNKYELVKSKTSDDEKIAHLHEVKAYADGPRRTYD